MYGKKTSLMEKRAHETDKKVHEILADQEMDLLLNTAIAWETLRPQISDKKSLEKLIAEVHEASRKNENIAQLKDRLETLGGKVMCVAKKVYFIIEE